VGIKELQLGVTHLPVDAALRTSVRLLGIAQPLAIYAVRVELGDVECLSATVSTYGVGRR
jgi:hypothetical protein